MRPQLLAAFLFTCLASAALARQEAPPVRCAVIGGMMETGLFDALIERFATETGLRAEVVASGPKDGIDRVFRQGEADLIVMHASDTIINLVADGFASDPQPWARNDMVLVGPADDPAGVAKAADAVAAIKQIAAAKAPVVVHSSLGAQEVLRDLMTAGNVEVDESQVTVLFADRHRQALKVAAEKKAYTLVGRIPFLSGKIPAAGLKVLLQGDRRLRRPYLVAVADPGKVAGARVESAKQLAAFLRSPGTQTFIAEFGKGRYDDHPLFFPVDVLPR